jgi:hypothetical protein
MLCKVCVGMPRGGRGETLAGTQGLNFEHHKTTSSLRLSREMDCSICTVLTNVLQQDIDLLEDRAISVVANFRRLPVATSRDIEYVLEFSMNKKYTRTYMLRETGESKQLR